jgi:hypothetical protein
LYIGEGVIQEFRVDNSSVFTSAVGRFSIHNANTKKIQEEHRTGLLHCGKLKAKFLEMERRWDEVKRGEMQYEDFFK